MYWAGLYLHCGAHVLWGDAAAVHHTSTVRQGKGEALQYFYGKYNPKRWKVLE